jgi:uncharacterized protein
MPSTQTVLITGASSGIGKEIALVFAQRGFNLVLTARNGAALDETAFGCKSHNVAVETFIANLAEESAPKNIVDYLSEKNIPIDILVNNAGFGSQGPFAELDLTRELEMVQVNVMALMSLTRQILPQMIARKAGRILNVASMAAFIPGPLMATYYATKSFVVSHSLALKQELRDQGVTVTILCPGPVHTNFAKNADIHRSKLFTQTGATPVEEVARDAVDGCLKGKSIIIPGALNKLMAPLLKILPHRWLLPAVMGRNKNRE